MRVAPGTTASLQTDLAKKITNLDSASPHSQLAPSAALFATCSRCLSALFPTCPLVPYADSGAGSTMSSQIAAEAVAKEIKEAREKIQKIEKELTAPQSDADQQFLRGRLLALEQQLPVLQERLLVQEKERLSQRQGAMPQGPPQQRSGAAPCCSLSGASRRSSIAFYRTRLAGDAC